MLLNIAIEQHFNLILMLPFVLYLQSFMLDEKIFKRIHINGYKVSKIEFINNHIFET